VKDKFTIDCSDLYDDAAEKLKGLDNDIDKTIQELAKKVEDRGIPKNKVARIVAKELIKREVLSPSRIYEGLGVEQKRKYEKKEIEKTFPRVENISTEESSMPRLGIELLTDGTQRESEDFDKLIRGQDVITESEKVKMLQRQLNDITKELETTKSERDSLSIENKVLKEKTQPEMLKEIQERFYDEPGLIKNDELQKVSEAAGKNLVLMLQRYNSVLEDAARAGQPVPVGLYVIARPGMMLVPIRLTIDFIKKKIVVSLWEKKLSRSYR
jgi:hypothetical protein